MVNLENLLDKYENEYKKMLDSIYDTPLEVNLRVFIKLYNEIKVENSISRDEDGDLLLFQYNNINFSEDENPEFQLDITRQIMIDGEEEPYQLSLKFYYNQSNFAELTPYSCWNDVFESSDLFLSNVLQTQGFNIASQLKPVNCKLELDEL